MQHALLNPRARGLVSVRADASEQTKLFAELRTSFEEFKAAREEEIKGLNAKFDDVVSREKVDRINAEITDLNKALNEVNAAIAASVIGPAGGVNHDPDVLAHSTAFNTWFRKGDRALDADMRELEVKAKMTTQSDPDGGFLVPEETEAGIDRVLGTVSTMRSLARVISIGTSTYKKLVNMGGAGAGWVGEEEARPETDTPTLREISINAAELYANPAITQTALDDARIDIAAWLADEVSIEFAEQEGTAFISGNGVNKPRGVLSYEAVANASYVWGKLGYVASGKAADFADTSTTVSKADALVDLYYALKSGYRNNASWLMSDAVMGTVRKFKDADGNFLWAPPTAAAGVATILGKPVANDDNMQAVGAGNFPIAFGDFNRGYLIVDRFGVRVLRDPYTNKPFVHFYTTKRVGGGVVNFEAIKLLKIAAS
ncbi:Phage major capsid protein, HK97 family [Devosia sp. LC5]|uniref:phage major capsid protein n=1 Tax=Devosia sp. LC5 TaxID=1502724 RepID=UPI0004E31BEB|nr:phage major capsid protein [Devosia sp. LC5]KFC62771.1 Phage major capsid protein, HK97 family [Devosia sp. LC5]